MMKRIHFGMRNKVMFGFMVIGVVLFLSGALAFFEFGRLNAYVESMIDDNYVNVNTTIMLMNQCDRYNTEVLEMISEEGLVNRPSFNAQDDFLTRLDELSSSIKSSAEMNMADSVKYAYVTYIHALQEMENVWYDGYTTRTDWYFNYTQRVYEQLKGYLKQLSELSQNSLAQNYSELKESFYRSIMPVIVAVAAGIILAFLFNYFLNIFLITPLIKMNKGAKSYLEFNKTYDVRFDSSSDQVQELNNSIKEIIDENMVLKKK